MRRGDVNVFAARNDLLPATLTNRLKKLVEQAKLSHADSAQIAAEIEEVHQQIAALKSDDLPESAVPTRLASQSRAQARQTPFPTAAH
jgi:hypothetical protein